MERRSVRFQRTRVPYQEHPGVRLPHQGRFGLACVGSGRVFNHPVTTVMWVVQKKANVTALDYFNFERTSGKGDDTITSAVIKFNGSERERARGPLYWRTLTSSEYFNRTPRKNMYMYSFAQYPLSWWPSGSANLSRIDNTTLEFTMPTVDADGAAFGEADVTVIAENFNVVRVQGGMMAKRYAN